MRADRRAVWTGVFAAAFGLAACGGGGSGEAGSDGPGEEVSTTRLRSDNAEACEHLRLVNDISGETGRLSGVVADVILSGGDDAAVLAAAEALAAHLSSTAPEVAAAFAEAAETAPASAAEAIDALAASAADSVPRLVELLRGATSRDEISRLYAALGAEDVPEEPEGDDELRRTISRYTDVICGFAMRG